jgi:hypothetical protein
LLSTILGFKLRNHNKNKYIFIIKTNVEYNNNTRSNRRFWPIKN